MYYNYTLHKLHLALNLSATLFPPIILIIGAAITVRAVLAFMLWHLSGCHFYMMKTGLRIRPWL